MNPSNPPENDNEAKTADLLHSGKNQMGGWYRNQQCIFCPLDKMGILEMNCKGSLQRDEKIDRSRKIVSFRLV